MGGQVGAQWSVNIPPLKTQTKKQPTKYISTLRTFKFYKKAYYTSNLITSCQEEDFKLEKVLLMTKMNKSMAEEQLLRLWNNKLLEGLVKIDWWVPHLIAALEQIPVLVSITKYSVPKFTNWVRYH